VTPLTSSFECASSVPEKCLATVSLFKDSVSGSDHLWVERTKGKSDLRLILADKDRLVDLRAKYEELYRGGTIENTSAECQLYVWVAGAVIVRAVTIVSVDAEPLHAQTCFIVNFARSLGLSLNDEKTFADAWGGDGNPKSELTSALYENLKYRIKDLLLIHACKGLRLGMTKREVELELTPESECLKGLR
jgi:hypothetical protein